VRRFGKPSVHKRPQVRRPMPIPIPPDHTRSSNDSRLWVAMAASHTINFVSHANYSLSHDARTRSRVPSEFKAQHNILLEPTLSTTSSFPHTPQPDTHRSRTWKGACSKHTRFNTNRKDNSTSVNSEHNATMEHYCSAAAVRSRPLAYRPPHTDTENPRTRPPSSPTFATNSIRTTT